MTALLVPDLDIAGKFLSMFDYECDGTFTFQTFDDDKQRSVENKQLRGYDPFAKVFHGELKEHQRTLQQMQQNRVGVFVMINHGDGVVHEGKKTCRTAANVTAVRALWVDLDGSPLDPVLAAYPPDIVVESSPGRWHGYWLTNDCPLEDFSPRQKQIATKFNGDKSVSDLPRVMRLPGFWHQKTLLL